MFVIHSVSNSALIPGSRASRGAHPDLVNAIEPPEVRAVGIVQVKHLLRERRGNQNIWRGGELAQHEGTREEAGR